LAGRFQSQAPEGYTFVTPPLKDANRSGTLSLQAPPEKLASAPTAVLVIKGQPGSTLDAPLKDKVFPLSDPTASSYDLGIVRLGLGVGEAHVRAKLPTEKLPNGRHRLRLTATRGWSNQSTAFVETDVVVRNGSGRLTLTPALDKLAASSKPTTVAKAKLEGAAAKEVEFFVDGHSVGTAQAPEFTFALDPARWGLGRHEVTARVRLEDGRRIFSDDAVPIEIVK
jgi:hypothetical protein